MAIYNGRILMRKGLEADFDASKLMSGEWALSTDKGIIRICLEAGKVIRMATYEAFEKDMEQVEAILLECKSIEEAVRRINTEVSEKLNACAEYVQQAKNYSEQAKTSEANAKSYMQSAKTSEENAKVSETNAKASENSAKEYENSAKLTEERAREVFESIPEDYSTISNDLYELAIKETASGEEIHVNDSSNLKLREFALYGKSEQNTTTGKNLLKNIATTKTLNNGTITVNENKSITINGTFTANTFFNIDFVSSSSNAENDVTGILEKELIASISDSPKSGITLIVGYFKNGGGSVDWIASTSSFTKIVFPSDAYKSRCYLNISSGTYNNVTIYPMISLDGGEYEPYSGGIPSPNPQYPQPIEVSGTSGSVEVKSCGKNFVDFLNPISKENTLTSTVTVTETANSVSMSGVRSGTWSPIKYFYYFSAGSYVLSAKMETDNGYTDLAIYVSETLSTGYSYKCGIKNSGSVKFTLNKPCYVEVRLHFTGNTGTNGATWNTRYYDVQIEKGDVATNFDEHKETLSTIPTENGLAGIKVSSGGNYTDSNGQQWICDEVVKYADGSGEYIQRIGKAVFDGSDDEEWMLNTANAGNQFAITISNNGSRYFLCTHFRNSGVNNWGNVPNLTYMVHPTVFKTVRFRYDACTTVDEWRANLQANPMTVYYELAEPIRTPITAEEIAEIEKLHTFYPVTNISNDFDCGMSVTYYCDSKNYIGNQLAIMKQEQEEAMANILMLMPTEVQAMMIENDTNDLLKESEI